MGSMMGMGQGVAVRGAETVVVVAVDHSLSG
jgi:hypothetical protein